MTGTAQRVAHSGDGGRPGTAEHRRHVRCVRRWVDRIFRGLDYVGRDPHLDEFSRAIQAGLVSPGMRGRVPQRCAVGDDTLFERAPLVGAERQDRAIEDSPVPDTPGDLLILVTFIS